MSTNHPEFRGAYTALITPFAANAESVDFARLAEQISFQAEGGVRGVVPCGTTGESPTLTETEHCEVIERTLESARPLGLQVIAGAGSNCTATAVHFQRFAAAAGADASLQVVPYYNRPSAEGLFRHFMAIADASDLPVVLYNIPGRSGVGLTIETIERLAAHPNITAIKEASGSIDLANEIATRTELTILAGDDAMILPLCAVGAVGVVSVLTNIIPRQVQSLCDACNQDRWSAARDAAVAIKPLARGLLSLDTNPIAIKAAMELLGRDNGVLRLPLVRGAETTFTKAKELLAQAGVKAGAGTGAAC